MISKFNSKCSVCKGQILVGDEINWKKGKGAWHPTCTQTQSSGFATVVSTSLRNQGLFLNYSPVCIAPVGAIHEQGVARCGEALMPSGGEAVPPANLNGRQCKNGHWSIKCDKCGVTSFPVGLVPKGQHETWFGQYTCRACGFLLFADEGANPSWGEFK